MTKYGNSGGKNRGKKYKKLTGYEVATPESTKRARAFMIWYGHNFERLKVVLKYRGRGFNDEVATDTALKIHDDILLKDLRIGSYKHYYFRAYHTNAMRNARDETRQNVIFSPLSNNNSAVEIEAPSFDSAYYEEVSDALNTELLDYVSANYSPYKCSIFEIYIGLQPDVTCRSLSIMLGLAEHIVWTVLNEIRQDVCAKFKGRKDYLLTLT